MSRHTCRDPGRRVTAVVIGGGHSGLATSHCLSGQGIDHVVLERGEVANAWRRERWDSLRLLTPNWQCRLPGYCYDGAEPAGFMTMSEVAAFIDRYAIFTAAPVLTGTRVTALSPDAGGYRVETSGGVWRARAVVIASGACSRPVVPAVASALPAEIESVTPHQYRNPQALAEGGVLVVGASATGLQIAEEVRRSGRPVTLAVGEHVRMPRRYRGRDIQHWMEVTGLLHESYREVEDIERARRLPSPQLVGNPEGRTLDLNALAAQGVRLAGRLAGIRDGTAQFSGALANVAKLADLKLGRLLGRIDEWITVNAPAGEIPAPERPEATRVESPPLLAMDLARSGVRTVVWATGFRPDYSWLRVPVLDTRGGIRHDGGVTPSPGLYVMGLPFMRRRSSSFISGAGEDARQISAHLAAWVKGEGECARARVA